MFMKTLTAGVLAVSLTATSLTPTAATAQISNEEALTGIITLLLLGAAIQNNRDDDVAPAPVRGLRRDERSRRRDLPADCIRNVTRRNGNRVRIFGQRCLNNNYAHVNRLPDECRVRVRTENGQRRQGFGVRCLREQGFRTNRR